MATGLAFVDVETTGLSPRNERVIEVAVLRVDEGEVTREFCSLINPERPIPSFIQGHTGITPRMVKNAPVFTDLVEQIEELLSGCIFIAHNVTFDYGFLQEEFRRSGKTFFYPSMCTAQLSRKLFPGYQRHNLDSIIERFGFECDNRHRAMDDVKVLWQFYQHAQKFVEL